MAGPVAWPVASERAAAIGATAGASFIGIATSQWLIIGMGLAIGVFARWAYLLSLRARVGWREIRIDLMIVPMNGVLAAQLADSVGLHDGKLLLAASMFGAASTMAFAQVHRRWLSKLGAIKVFSGPDKTFTLPVTDRPIEFNAVGPDTPKTVGEYEIRELRAMPLPDRDPKLDRLIGDIEEWDLG